MKVSILEGWQQIQIKTQINKEGESFARNKQFALLFSLSNYISKEFPPEFIWSSALLRATQSTEILSNAVKCPVEYLIELCEMQKRESELDFRLRAENILAAVRERSKQYKRIAIVSHGGVITKIIDSFLQLPKEHDVWFHTDNTGIYLLEYKPSVCIIRFSNNTTHLN